MAEIRADVDVELKTVDKFSDDLYRSKNYAALDDDFNATINLGMCSRNSRHYNEDYCYQLYDMMGQIYLEGLGRPASIPIAISYFQKSINEAEQPQALLHLATAYRKAGDATHEMEMLQRALKWGNAEADARIKAINKESADKDAAAEKRLRQEQAEEANRRLEYDRHCNNPDPAADCKFQ